MDFGLGGEGPHTGLSVERRGLLAFVDSIWPPAWVAPVGEREGEDEGEDKMSWGSFVDVWRSSPAVNSNSACRSSRLIWKRNGSCC